MCEPATIATIATVGAGALSAYGSYQEGASEQRYQNYVADQNVQQGKLALERGQRQSERIQDTAKEEGKRLEMDSTRHAASQRAAMAAAGVQGVTAEDIVSDSFSSEKLDELTLRYNADARSYETTESAKYEDYALRSKADQHRMAGKNAKRAGKINAFSTLLGTAASVAGGYR